MSYQYENLNKNFNYVVFRSDQEKAFSSSEQSSIPLTTEASVSTSIASIPSTTSENSLFNGTLPSSTTVLNLLLNTTETLVQNKSTYSTEEPASSFFHENLDVALMIYGGIILACILAAVGKILLFIKVCMRSSRSIHEEMFSCVLSAPMQFFDKQTSGEQTEPL